jgi:adenosylhomocysteine nucleosidase
VPTALAAILALTAAEVEARALARALSLPSLPSLPFVVFGDGPFRVAPVGIGACLLKERWPVLVASPDHPLVISTGVCGALDPALGVGDVVLGDSVIDEAGTRHIVTADPRVRATVAQRARTRQGAMVSTSHVVATPEAKAALRAETGGVAVDMESAAIVGMAAAHGCPSLVLRGVSDDARESLPEALLSLLSADGRLRARALLALAHPRLLGAALRLRRTSRQALESVAGSLALLAA